jgi:hypothetical protein
MDIDGWISMDIDGWISMDGYRWMDIDGWISMDGYRWMDIVSPSTYLAASSCVRTVLPSLRFLVN